MKTSKHLIQFLLIAILSLTVSSRAQPAADRVDAAKLSAGVTTFQLDSKLMKRQMPYGIFLPPNYETDKQARFPVVYLLHGLSGSYKTFAENPERLADYSKRHSIFVFVEGGAGFFTDSATIPNDKYESYVIQELIPEVDKKFRTIADRGGRSIAGVSMGGYGAIKYAVKYPQLFSLAASWSGVVNASSWRKISELPPRPRTIQAVTAVFGDGSDPAPLIANDLFQLFEGIPSERVADLPFFYLDCGIDDELLKPNQRLAELFLKRKIRHEYRQIPGPHGLQDYRVIDVLNLNERLFAGRNPATTPK